MLNLAGFPIFWSCGTINHFDPARGSLPFIALVLKDFPGYRRRLSPFEKPPVALLAPRSSVPPAFEGLERVTSNSFFRAAASGRNFTDLASGVTHGDRSRPPHISQIDNPQPTALKATGWSREWHDQTPAHAIKTK